jgi:caffeoyl-CoA O-methyltransferase
MLQPAWPVPAADNYAAAHTSPLSPLLLEVLDYTLANHPKHHMVSGAVQGQFLRMLSSMVRPRRVLEVGTFTGFSALCLAEGLTPDGHLYTLELREEDAATARSFFIKSAFNHQITCLSGAAADLIPTFSETWDLVFLDADKTGYAHYRGLAFGRQCALSWRSAAARCQGQKCPCHTSIQPKNDANSRCHLHPAYH